MAPLRSCVASLAVAAGLSAALSCRPSGGPVGAAPSAKTPVPAAPKSVDEIEDLVRLVGPPRRFAAHEPDFSVEERTFTFRSSSGPARTKMWVVMDGERHVALYVPELSIMDVITHDPGKAPRELEMPYRYTSQTIFDTRLTTILWYDLRGVSGESHGFAFSGGGKTVTLTEWQEWRNRRTAKSVHTFTVSCDPVHGYVVDVECSLETDDRDRRFARRRRLEFVNVLTRDVANVWPGRWRHDTTVYSPEGRSFAHGFAGWRNNPAAARFSDNVTGGLRVRERGFVAFLADEDGWGPALSRRGASGYTLSTGEVWQEQHNYVAVPRRPDADGFYRMGPRFRLAWLPPEVTKYVLEHTAIDDFSEHAAFRPRASGSVSRPRQVIVRFGVSEGFEDQPLPMTTATRGAWGETLGVSEDEAHSGARSLVVRGLPRDRPLDRRTGFLLTPQIPLDPGSVYLLECWVKVAGGDTEAYISADLYESSPHEDAPAAQQRTGSVTPEQGWRYVTISFKAPPYDVFVDLRFIALGEGSAYFDDFSMTKVPEPRRARYGER